VGKYTMRNYSRKRACDHGVKDGANSDYGTEGLCQNQSYHAKSENVLSSSSSMPSRAYHDKLPQQVERGEYWRAAVVDIRQSEAYLKAKGSYQVTNDLGDAIIIDKNVRPADQNFWHDQFYKELKEHYPTFRHNRLRKCLEQLKYDVNSSARLKESMELFMNNIIHTYGFFFRKLNSVFVALSRSEIQQYLRQHVASAVRKNQFVIKQEKRISLNKLVFNHPLVLFSSLVPREFFTLAVVCGSHKVKDSKLATIVHRKDVMQVVIPFGWLFLIDGLVFHSGQESGGINSQARLHAQI
jgi:hypothetical protein